MIQPLVPERPRDRFDVYRFFNGLSAEGQEGPEVGRTRIPLAKTFLLEHVSCRTGRVPKPPQVIFESLGTTVTPIDDTFMEIRDRVKGEAGTPEEVKVVGYVEQYDERFFAYYTPEKSQDARSRVRRWIIRCPDLDATWFSGALLQILWDRDVSNRGDDRFGKLTFRHESVYDLPEDATEQSEQDEEEEASEEEERPERESRKARFEMGDRIGRIKASLGKLQSDYNPLNALFALRFPSRLGHGSHDLYQFGQVTNRTNSFEDHRNLVRYLYRRYKALLDWTETAAWHRMEAISTVSSMQVGVKGVPLTIRFEEPLAPAAFNRWVAMAFQRRNQFRLWGDPIRLGPTKVHAYGADRHLWQPINIEMTNERLVAILPHGTCGNTFHRLVTNVQRFVCPKIEAWIGEKPFKAVVDESQVEPERDE
jgi:hypothetical protein